MNTPTQSYAVLSCKYCGKQFVKNHYRQECCTREHGQKFWKENNEAYKAHCREREKKRYYAEREKRLQQAKEYRDTHKEYYKEYNKIYYQEQKTK